MKGRHLIRIWDMPLTGEVPSLLAVTGFFVVGAIAGSISAASVGGLGGEALSAYIVGCLDAVKSGASGQIDFWRAAWAAFRWPALAAFLGLTALGAVGIPALFGCRGFLLAFSITAFVRMFGAPGFGAAFILIGISCLLSLPALFMLGTQALRAAVRRIFHTQAGQKMPGFDRGAGIRLAICAGLSALCIPVELYLIPAFAGTLIHL